MLPRPVVQNLRSNFRSVVYQSSRAAMTPFGSALERPTYTWIPLHRQAAAGLAGVPPGAGGPVSAGLHRCGGSGWRRGEGGAARPRRLCGA